MSTIMNVHTKVRSMAPIMIHATTFFPTFCLAPLLIYFPPYDPASAFIIVIFIILVRRSVKIIITAVADR